MSYILEALKKADADRERERAGVPDLRAQLDAAAPDGPLAPALQRRQAARPLERRLPGERPRVPE